MPIREVTYLSALGVHFVNNFDPIEVVNARIQANLIHDHNTRRLGVLVKFSHRWRDVARRDDMGFSLDSGFDDLSVMCIRDKGYH